MTRLHHSYTLTAPTLFLALVTVLGCREGKTEYTYEQPDIAGEFVPLSSLAERDDIVDAPQTAPLAGLEFTLSATLYHDLDPYGEELRLHGMVSAFDISGYSVLWFDISRIWILQDNFVWIPDFVDGPSPDIAPLTALTKTAYNGPAWQIGSTVSVVAEVTYNMTRSVLVAIDDVPIDGLW